MRRGTKKEALWDLIWGLETAKAAEPSRRGSEGLAAAAASIYGPTESYIGYWRTQTPCIRCSLVLYTLKILFAERKRAQISPEGRTFSAHKQPKGFSREFKKEAIG